jgi:hypothetical protein
MRPLHELNFLNLLAKTHKRFYLHLAPTSVVNFRSGLSFLLLNWPSKFSRLQKKIVNEGDFWCPHLVSSQRKIDFAKRKSSPIRGEFFIPIRGVILIGAGVNLIMKKCGRFAFRWELYSFVVEISHFGGKFNTFILFMAQVIEKTYFTQHFIQFVS